MPAGPVPVIYDGKCPEGRDLTYHDDNFHGGGKFRPEGGGTNLHICTATSFCGTSIRDAMNSCSLPQQDNPENVCDMVSWAYWYGAGGQWGIKAVLGPNGEPGFFRDSDGHYFDAYGREFVSLNAPALHDWTWRNWCPPAVPATPHPSPSVTPPPQPSPSAPPGTAVIPKLGQCPAEWVGMKPDHVKLGKHPWRAPANPHSWIFNTSPIMERAEYCLDENGKSRGVPCEAWGPCFEGNKYRPAARAWGPGWPSGGDEVERRSGNAWLLNIVLGEHGSPAGTYRVCVAPTDAELSGPNAECYEFDLTEPQ